MREQERKEEKKEGREEGDELAFKHSRDTSHMYFWCIIFDMRSVKENITLKP